MKETFKFTLIDRIFYSSTFYSVHKSQVEDSCEKIKIGTFEDFLTEYYCSDMDWSQRKEYPKSHFCYKNDSKVHANIIKFRGIGMILKTKTDYKKFKKWEEDNLLRLPISHYERWSTLCGDDK